MTHRVALKVFLPMVLAIALLAGLLGAVVATGNAEAGPGNPGYLRRFAANYHFGSEIFTDLPPAEGGQGGMPIYNNDFFTANDINTLYVTISAVGDVHNGRRMQMACLLDGDPCNPSASEVAGGAGTGWVTVMRHDNYNENYDGPGFVGDGGGGASDVHDNVVAYTWCTPISGAGTHNVELRMASDPAPFDPGEPFRNNNVFIEAAHFFIDGSRVADEADACTPIAAAGATTPATVTGSHHGNLRPTR